MYGKPGTGSEQQGHPKRLFSTGELRLMVQGPHACTVTQPTKREEYGHNLLLLRASHKLIKGVGSKVAYQYQPGATVQSVECGLHSGLRTWAGNWAPVIIVTQTEPPSLQQHRKGKMEPSPKMSAGTRKICRTSWAGLTISRRLVPGPPFFPLFFLLFKSKTEVLELRGNWEQIQRSQKAKTNS